MISRLHPSPISPNVMEELSLIRLRLIEIHDRNKGSQLAEEAIQYAAEITGLKHRARTQGISNILDCRDYYDSKCWRLWSQE